MINQMPWIFPNEPKSKSIIDEKRVGVKEASIKWVTNYIPKEFRLIIRWVQPVDEFGYPSLSELRSQFEATGLYTDRQIEGIMKSYERLPKYNQRSRSARRSKSRS